MGAVLVTFDTLPAGSLDDAIRSQATDGYHVGVGSNFDANDHLLATSRQQRARAKLAMDRGDFRRPFAGRVAEIYRTPYAQEQVLRHFSAEANPQQRMADAVCVAYRTPPQRRLRSKSATSSLNKALKASKLDRAMRYAARAAFLTGVSWVHVCPEIVNDKLVPRTKVITQDRVVRCWYGSDPDHPDAMLCTFAADADSGIAGHDRVRFAFIDADGVRYLNEGGEVVDWRTNAMAAPPLAEVRDDERHEEDPWGQHRNDKLYTATLDVARLIAHMRWVRKEQSRKLIVMTGESADDIPEGQAKGPELPVVIAANPADFEIQILDFDQAITNSEAEINALLERLAESYGLSSKVLNPSRSVQESSDASLRAEEHSALASLRDSQTMHLAEGDRAACVRVARACQVCGVKCPAPDVVAEQLEITYAPMSFVDHPLTSLQISAERIKLGMSDHLTEYMARHPDLSRDEAEARLREHIEMRNAINEMLSVHQIQKDPREEGEQLSAQQGRIGGQATPEPKDTQE
jgi:hypothetical protein